jgi:hypothetical protein
VRLAVVTALALPLLALLADVSVDASLSVLGFDAFGAGVELHGQPGMALLLGAVWGAGAGAAGALLARATGAAGTWATALALRDTAAGREESVPVPGPVGQRPYEHGPGRTAQKAGRLREADRRSGPYVPGAPYRPPNPATNPYLRMPEGAGEPQGERSGDDDACHDVYDDVYDAPTMVGPFEPPARPPRRPPGPARSDPPRSGRRSPGDGPMPPPPPPPPPPPDRPGGGR